MSCSTPKLERYCVKKASEPSTDPRWSNSEAVLQEVSANDVHQFWIRVLGKLGCGKDGCKLRGIKKTSSLNSNWKFFQHYYEKVTENPVSQEMNKCVSSDGMQFLANKFKPDGQVHDSIPVYIKDTAPFNQIIFQTRETQLHPGLQRLLLCFYSMLGLFTVNRENAILNL
ncbi:hypothetical protein EMCG_06269 [[Emmonsia] crescens]|uniref:Uncharacterized protein n=1 Tax=[Emmonsia] crescens TaxID=73230 RepID=A0A0G2IBM3_9EURO|nr:hypothetical protein EMCG_06269 [Emmonsia crescens UAMH 3008]